MRAIPPEKDKGVESLTDRVIYLISSNKAQSELMASFLLQKTGAKCLTFENVLDTPSLDAETTEAPRLILLDCLGKDLASLLGEIESLDQIYQPCHRKFELPPQYSTEFLYFNRLFNINELL